MNLPDTDHSDELSKPHWSFWAITIVMLVWNLMGCINFLIQLDASMLAAFRESERAIIENRPLWATLGFALSVFGGLFGCVLLLMKKNWAPWFFFLSLAGTFVTISHSLLLDITFSTGELIGIVAMPIVVSVFLVTYARLVQKKQWIR